MDPYSVLGLQRGASEEEAKTAFKKLAKTCHPDLHPDDPNAEKRFKEINEAYDRIKNGDKPNPMNFRTGNYDFRFNDGAGFRFEDLFQQVRQRNHDIHLECRLTLEEAFHGKELNIQIPNGHEPVRNVKVTIPPGMRTGMRISMAKSGSQTIPTMPPGDLYVAINVLPHSRFLRDNANNLITIVPTNAFDVLLCKAVMVDNIEGKTLSVDIPPGHDSSKKLKLTGQGMPDPYTKIRGDLLVELFVTYPELTEDQKKLVEAAR